MKPKQYTADELQAIKKHLKDWRWRFSNLYWIQPAEKDIPECIFKPRKEQWEILEAIYERGEVRLAILKARQMGFSTLIAIICLDMILFNAGFVCGIVDQNQQDAQKKREKVKYAWTKLPDDIKGAFSIIKDNESEFSIQRGDRAISTVYAGTNARGGTHQLLWVSEWGAIQFDDPKRSDEIADGALPSAEQGIVIVETTWKGGKTGRLYTEIVEPALKLSDEYRTKEDYKIYFFSWWLDERYQREGDVKQISKECNDYFDSLEEDGIYLNDKQKLWYFKVAWVKGQHRYEEYPSQLSEIFLSPVEGAIYAKLIDKAETEGRIIDFAISKEPVFTFWDLGKRDLMVITFIQIVGLQVRIIDTHMDRGEALKVYAMFCQKWEVDNNAYIGGHFLPHDGGYERIGTTYNKSIQEMLGECGLRNINVVPRIPRISIGIDNVRDRIPEMVFHKTNLERVYEFGVAKVSMMEGLQNYRYAPLAKNARTREPVHDIYSHPCDSLRTYAEADERGLVPKSAGLEAIEDREDAKDTRANVGNFDFW